MSENSGWNHTLTETQKATLRDCLRAALPDALRIQHIGPDAIYRIACAGLDLAIKRSRSVSGFKSGIYQKQGTPAERAFKAARYLRAHRVGTAEPVCFFETWNGNQLENSDYVCLYLADHLNFRVLFFEAKQRGDVEAMKKLVVVVGEAIARMHAAHFLHRDLGSQNILLPKNPKEWSADSVKFLDLNRGRIVKRISFFTRAKEFARLHPMGAYQKIFMQAYAGEGAQLGLRAMIVFYHFRFWLKGRTHVIRHPIRALKK